MNKQEKCCDWIEFQGNFLSSTSDSLKFNLIKSKASQKLNSDYTPYFSNYLSDNPAKTIAKNDIIYISHNKSRKQRKLRDTISGAGAILMVGGLLTAVNALALADNNRDDLLIVSGIEFFGGIALGMSFNNKKKKFKASDDPWRFK